MIQENLSPHLLDAGRSGRLGFDLKYELAFLDPYDGSERASLHSSALENQSPLFIHVAERRPDA
jgi:hypothetical protein